LTAFRLASLAASKDFTKVCGTSSKLVPALHLAPLAANKEKGTKDII
jgi:hypothetical protein